MGVREDRRGARQQAHPSYEAPFLFIDVVPIAFIDIRARAGYMQFYRALGYGFYGAHHMMQSTANRSVQRRAGGTKGDSGLISRRVCARGLASAAFVNTFTYTRIDFGERGYFYEPYEDVALRCTDHTFMNDTILVWRFGRWRLESTISSSVCRARVGLQISRIGDRGLQRKCRCRCGMVCGLRWRKRPSSFRRQKSPRVDWDRCRRLKRSAVAAMAAW